MRITIKGEPIVGKSGPKTGGLETWEEKLNRVCGGKPHLPLGDYRVRITFVIPKDRYQSTNKQNPNAKDLDNLLFPVFNALSKTVLADAGGDGAIVQLVAEKRKTGPAEEPYCRATITQRFGRTA